MYFPFAVGGEEPNTPRFKCRVSIKNGGKDRKGYLGDIDRLWAGVFFSILNMAYSINSFSSSDRMPWPAGSIRY